MKDRTRNLFLLGSSVGISLIILEVGLRLLTPLPFKGEMPNTVPHEKLGYTASPKLFGIDRHGFRNPENQHDPVIVALGDSHTYGFNVASHNSWPYQLARKSGLAVYNYGMGGYGILHYVFLFNEAINKNPEHIILGFYPANDLADYCALATLPYWQTILRRAHLNSAVCVERQDEKKTESSTLAAAIKSTLKRTAVGSAFDYYIWDELGDLFDEMRDRKTSEKKCVGIEIQRDNHQTCISYARLIRHVNTMDPKDMKIREAVRASEYFFSRMMKKARQHNVKFSVLVIPSKERVLFEWVKKQNIGIDEKYAVHYRRLVRHEEALVQRFHKFFENHGVQVVDALPYMREVLRDGRALYPSRDDGHPLKIGYNLYAQAALKLVQKKSVDHRQKSVTSSES